jgi:hypothetical protein
MPVIGLLRRSESIVNASGFFANLPMNTCISVKDIFTIYKGIARVKRY